MIQGGQQLGFATKPSQSLGIGRNTVRQHLDGDLALQSGIKGAVHLAHAAGPEQVEDLIWAEPCTGAQGHCAAL